MAKDGQKYLKDRRTGELYGWNHEMSKLPYMMEVIVGEEGWDDGKPDPNYVDPEAPPPSQEVFPQSGTAAAELAADADKVTAEALEKAAKQGREDLDADDDKKPDDAAPFDENGCMLLGYDDADQPVYETEEERDERVAAEAKAAPHEEPRAGEETGPAPVEEEQPKRSRKK